MGYDSNECLFCYCAGGGNNPCNDTDNNLCSECFLENCPSGLRGRATLSSYVQISPSETCYACGLKNRICLYQISLCEGHKFPQKDDKEEDDNKEEEENKTPCNGYCSCPHCPNQTMKEKFMK